MNKPKVLYHASQNKNLSIIEPRDNTVRDPKEGPVVFASPDKAGVTKFLVPSDDSWTRKSRFGEIHVHVIKDKSRYLKNDKGGAIYHLHPDTFYLDDTKGGSKDEWTSRKPVKPLKKELYDSALNAQIKNSVQVYFVDEDTFEKICSSEDHGNEIIRGLKSENQKIGVNPLEVPSIG